MKSSSLFLSPTDTAEQKSDPTLPLRNEVALADTWDLSHLFADEDAWEVLFKELQKSYSEVTQFRGTLGGSAQQLLNAIEFEKKQNQSLELLAQYASLKLAEDSSAAKALERQARLSVLITKIHEAASFMAPEIQAIEEDLFLSFLEDPILEPWQCSLKKLRRLRNHILSDKEERLIALSHEALCGHQETFSQLTNIDMQFGHITLPHEEKVALTQSSLSRLLEHPERKIRQETFEKFYQEVSDHRYTIASSLSHSIKADVFHAKARNYPSSLEAALFDDDITTSVYDTLIQTVREGLPLLHNYYELRKSYLQLKELHVYDTYVPLVQEFHHKRSFDQAITVVLDALQPLGEQYCQTLKEGLSQQRWCDRYENKGKRSGAFSCGTYQGPPYILMNYQEEVFSDVYTLAHEAGHSMHTWYSRQYQTFQDYHYPIFLAEVASTFNEILLTEHLLANTENPLERAYIINRQIDDLRSTLFRQTMFAEFEKITHQAEEAGEALVLDFFRKSYRSLLEEYFGPNVQLDDFLELECLRIPHFYHAFYVYQYATGVSAAISLAGDLLKTGNTTPYLTFLQSGGSRFPLDTLYQAGVDMNTSAPIEQALALFSQRTEELRSLLS